MRRNFLIDFRTSKQVVSKCIFPSNTQDDSTHSRIRMKKSESRLISSWSNSHDSHIWKVIKHCGSWWSYDHQLANMHWFLSLTTHVLSGNLLHILKQRLQLLMHHPIVDRNSQLSGLVFVEVVAPETRLQILTTCWKKSNEFTRKIDSDNLWFLTRVSSVSATANCGWLYNLIKVIRKPIWRSAGFDAHRVIWGLSVDGSRISNLKVNKTYYAYGTVLLATNAPVQKYSLLKVKAESKVLGLRFNAIESSWFMLQNVQLITQFTSLGHGLLYTSGGCSTEIRRCLAMANQQWLT